ncbi:sigma-70 family RNA polymerase sigma factor [Streptomyces albidoflavus]
MDGERDALTTAFEAERPRLRAVAYRMLGSLAEAEDAVQETWLRPDRAGVAEVGNLPGWLTTVLSRICLNLLRSRTTRREDPYGDQAPEPVAPDGDGEGDPAREAVLADEVGPALLVVLDTLGPAERLAFVLHDLFAVPFAEIAPLLERTPAATRQLAGRARRRVRGADAPAAPEPARQRKAVDAFLAATRGGDFTALVSLLAPDVVLRADARVVPTPEPVTVRGAERVARGAMAAMGRARFTGVGVVGGVAGLVMARGGRLALVLEFTVADGLISAIEVTAAPESLAGLEITAPDA